MAYDGESDHKERLIQSDQHSRKLENANFFTARTWELHYYIWKASFFLFFFLN